MTMQGHGPAELIAFIRYPNARQIFFLTYIFASKERRPCSALWNGR